MDLYKGMDQLHDLSKLYMDMKTPQVQEETVAPEQVDERAKEPYAIGMAQAMKQTGDTPPLEKSTIKKAHKIAKAINKEEVENIEEVLSGERYKKVMNKPGGTAYSRKVSADPSKRATRGGRGGESDFGAGDRGSGNKAARRASELNKEEFEIEEGMTLKDFKKKRSAQKQKDKRAAEKTSPLRRAGIHDDKASPERDARHRANVDPDFDGDDSVNYPGGKLKNPKKIRKAKALGELGDTHKKTGGKYRSQYVEDVGVVDEKMNLATADMGDVVKDFYKSDAPQFKGKTKKERQKMAIAAKLTAERGGKRLGE